MSSNGPPGNYCGALEVNLKTCAKGTKLKVYKHLHLFVYLSVLHKKNSHSFFGALNLHLHIP